MPDAREIDAVFFDIGGTLGERDANTGAFHAYVSSASVLKKVRDLVGLRVGIITTLGGQMSDDDARAMLGAAGLADFLDPAGFVSDNSAGAAKPNPAVYRFAAQKMGVPVARCLYVGESLVEVIGALAAGMKAVLKPCPPGRDVAAETPTALPPEHHG
jgi:FMN phosphatase YigB (HAD superfamily)